MPDAPASEKSGLSLHGRWARERASLFADPSGAYKFTKLCNREGESLLALEVVEAALHTAARNEQHRLLEQKALALARMGSVEKAEETLKQLRTAGAESSEVFGLLGRVYKDLAETAETVVEKKRLRAESLKSCQTGFERFGDAYCGINAAAQAVLLDESELAERLARETLAAPSQGNEYYDLATQAEAHLILREEDKAADFYRKASGIFKGAWADIASTRKQCRALAQRIFGEKDKFEPYFPKAAVAVFAGHVIDAPDRNPARFPSEAEAGVRSRIVDWLKRENIRISFCSAACGADLIFLSVAAECGVETHLVLPFRAEDFIETSVRIGGKKWVARFREAVEQAKSVTIVNEEVADEKSSAYEFANRMVAAKAKLRAMQLDLPVMSLAVWDSEPRALRGGTADAVASWAEAKIRCHVIHPTQPDRDGAPVAGSVSGAQPFPQIHAAIPDGSRTEVRMLVHVYFAGYFGLRENERTRFQQTTLGGIARVLAQSTNRPLARHGLGPDYVFVCAAFRSAALLANELLAEVRRQAESGPVMELPRICLHAGPVQLMVNPILNQYAHEGAVLTRAGRLARRVPSGAVHCTEAFASLAALESLREFRFEYHGAITHPDGTGDRVFRFVSRGAG